MASHSSTLAWQIPWTEEPGRLQSIGSLSRTQLSDFTFTFHFHALEKEMATHSSVLAWRIPGMGEPGGLPSMGSHRVRHDWIDLAAAAAAFSRRGASSALRQEWEARGTPSPTDGSSAHTVNNIWLQRSRRNDAVDTSQSPSAHLKILSKFSWGTNIILEPVGVSSFAKPTLKELVSPELYVGQKWWAEGLSQLCYSISWSNWIEQVA